MTAPSEWFGEPHTLTVHSVTPPESEWDDGELDYEIEHPASCKEEVRGEGDASYTEYTCELARHEYEENMATTLRYSGTPVTEPGTYQIGSWGRKYYVWECGAYEYDGGIGVIDPAEDGAA